MNTKKSTNYSFLYSVLVLSTLACNLTSAFVKKTARLKVIPTLEPAEEQQLQDQLATQINEAASRSADHN